MPGGFREVKGKKSSSGPLKGEGGKNTKEKATAFAENLKAL